MGKKKNSKSWQTELILVYKVSKLQEAMLWPQGHFPHPQYHLHSGQRLGGGLKSHSLAEECGNVREPVSGTYHPIQRGSLMSAIWAEGGTSR